MVMEDGSTTVTGTCFSSGVILAWASQIDISMRIARTKLLSRRIRAWRSLGRCGVLCCDERCEAVSDLDCEAGDVSDK